MQEMVKYWEKAGHLDGAKHAPDNTVMFKGVVSMEDRDEENHANEEELEQLREEL